MPILFAVSPLRAIRSAPDHDAVDLVRGHERRGRAVGDHRMRDPELLELPRGEARALEQWTGLVDENVLDPSCLPGGADRAERGPVAAGREPAGVAVREDPRTGGNSSMACAPIRRHRSTSSAWIAVRRSAVGSARISSSAQRRFTAVGLDASSVALAWSRSSPRRAASAMPVGSRDADRGRAAHSERPDRLGHRGDRLTAELDLLVRQPALVEDDDRVTIETNDPLWQELGANRVEGRALARPHRSRHGHQGGYVPSSQLAR